MARFHYRASTLAGDLQEGEMDAGSEQEVADRLSALDLLPLRIDAAAISGGGGGLSLSFGPRGGRIRQKDIVVLTGELATLLQAGLPLDRALQVMIQVAERPAVATLMSQVRDEIHGGSSLAEALATREHIFGRFYINMLHAGEAGGAMEVVLARMAEYLERSKALKETVTSALIYPVILLVVAVTSVLVLLTFVVPQFAQMFNDVGKALPVPTQIVMAVGEALRSYWWAIIGGTVATVWGLRRLFRDEQRRAWLDARLLKLPLVGRLITEVETSRFARTLGTLLSNGVSLLQAMSIVANTLSNRVLVAEVQAASGAVREGRGLADTLAASRRFPPFAIHMIQVGEESGQLEEMLLKVAVAFDNEVNATIKRLLALLEPAMILGLGAIIAGIIISILMAIMGVNELAF